MQQKDFKMEFSILDALLELKTANYVLKFDGDNYVIIDSDTNKIIGSISKDEESKAIMKLLEAN